MQAKPELMAKKACVDAFFCLEFRFFLFAEGKDRILLAQVASAAMLIIQILKRSKLT